MRGVRFWVRVVIGLLFCSFGVRSCARLCLVKGCWVKVSVGVCGCLGEGCVVGGGVVPVWLGDAVAGGGVGVSFDAGSRVFVLSGVSVPVSGSGASVSSPAASGSSLVGSLASECGGAIVSGSVSAPSPESGCVVPVSSPVGSVPSLSPSCGGVVVCVPCAARVFGDGWCGLVLRRWARAAGVGVGVVDALLSDSGVVAVGGGRVVADGGVGSGSSSTSVLSPSEASLPVSVVSGSSSSARSPVSARVSSRVGVGFGARVRDWGARVGVGGGVVSGGGVVAGWWARARGRVRALVSGVGVKGLVLAGLVGVVVLVSVLVLVG